MRRTGVRPLLPIACVVPEGRTDRVREGCTVRPRGRIDAIAAGASAGGVRVARTRMPITPLLGISLLQKPASAPITQA